MQDNTNLTLALYEQTKLQKQCICSLEVTIKNRTAILTHGYKKKYTARLLYFISKR